MRRAMGGDNGIERKIQFAGLQEFLQQRLGIFAQRFGVNIDQYRFVLPGDNLAGRVEPAIKEDGGEQSLKRIGQNGRSTEARSEEHTSELQSRPHLVCRLLLEKKKIIHL